MFAPSLALLVLLAGTAPASDPASLVDQLGSPRFAERERAASGLLELGAGALPALRGARSARDAEVRTRASAILDRIESDLMVRPTLVALDFRDRPLAEVLRTLSDRSRMVLRPDEPDDRDSWPARKVSLESPEPVPFWAAIDRLCDAGGLRYSPGAVPDVSGRERAGLLLSQGKPRGRAASDQGPFRVKVMRIHHSRDRIFETDDGPDAPAAETAEEFEVQLEVFAEPRLLIGQVGPLVLSEAIDERGRSLRPPAQGEAAQGDDDSSYDDQNFGQGAVTLLIPLRFPNPPCAAIGRLRGSVPILVASRKEGPLDLPLADAAVKVHSNGDLRVKVHEFKPEADGMPATIELSVRPGPDAANGPSPRSGENPIVATATALEHQVEVVDAKGRILPWSLTSQEVQGDGNRVTIAISPPEEAGPPARLLIYGLSRATVRVPFEFKDIPTP